MDDLITGLLYAFSSIVTTFSLLLVLVALYVGCCRSRGVRLGDGVPGLFDDLQLIAEAERDALEVMDDRSKQSYLMAKRWVEQNPPNSSDTDLSLSQYMAVQDKGVAAYEFTFDIRQQPSVFVANRTQIEFNTSNTIACVQSNLPLLKEKQLYYWEVKIFALEPGARCSVGLTTKPYPLFRLPGMHLYSIAYDSTGHTRLNQPFKSEKYGRQWQRGDVIGVGYRTSTGTVFFTHNGKKLDEAVHGMRLNVFPSIGATGKANVYVNFGQDGFVFIPANVNNWGLAPAQGSLPPPPAYGNQNDSVLLESTAVAGPSAPPYMDAELHTPPGSPEIRASGQNQHNTGQNVGQSSNPSTEDFDTPPSKHATDKALPNKNSRPKKQSNNTSGTPTNESNTSNSSADANVIPSTNTNSTNTNSTNTDSTNTNSSNAPSSSKKRKKRKHKKKSKTL